MPTPLPIVILVLVLAITSLGFSAETQAAGAVAPIAGPVIRPLDIVKSPVSRGLAERMRTAPSRRAQSHDAVGSATAAELETSARGRLAAGLLLGAAYGRWR